MTTYASPRITRQTLQILISIIFLFGCYLLLVCTINTINLISDQSRLNYGNQTANRNSSSSSNDNEDEDYYVPRDYSHPTSRFPSISSYTVQVIFALITLSNGIFGIVAITKEKTSLISMYSYVLLISCFTKLIFIIATLLMFTIIQTKSNNNSINDDNGKSKPQQQRHQDFLTPFSTLIIITSIIEIILVMCACQFGKLVKRGDAARQEIQSIHSYHLERRSRSRSQSQTRLRNNQFEMPTNSSVPRINLPSSSVLNISRNVSVEPSMISGPSYMPENDDNSSYYVPPPIYLKLDR